MSEKSDKLDSETLEKEISNNTCECQRFSSSSKILSAFTSEEETQHLLSWLEGDLIFLQGQRARGQTSTSCGKPAAYKKCQNGHSSSETGGRCPNRIGAAFCILNAIRDGAHELLRGEQGPGIQSSSSSDAQHQQNSKTSRSPFQQGERGYENDFPSIMSSTTAKSNETATVLKGRKKPKKKKNAQLVTTATVMTVSTSKNNKNKKVPINITKSPKRRIRPTTLAAKIPTSQSIWGAPSNTTTTTNNLSSAPTTASFIHPSSKLNGKWGNSMSLPNTKYDPMERAMNNSSKSGGPTLLMESKFVATEKNDPMKRVMPSNEDMKFRQKDTIHNKFKPLPSQEETQSKDKAGTELSRKIDAQNPSVPVESIDKGIMQIDLDPNEKERLSLISKRVSKVYCALILNQMVPSIGLELQLMLRLLSLGDEQQYTTDQNSRGESTVTVLSEVFGRVDLCRNFAIDVLTRLRILIGKFGNDILIPLLSLKPLTEGIPCLEVDIRTTLDSRLTNSNALLLEPGQSGSNIGAGLGTSGKSTILTIPFQEKRDSRHNYRTKDLSNMFNNREQSRGAYIELFQFHFANM